MIYHKGQKVEEREEEEDPIVFTQDVQVVDSPITKITCWKSLKALLKTEFALKNMWKLVAVVFLICMGLIEQEAFFIFTITMVY